MAAGQRRRRRSGSRRKRPGQQQSRKRSAPQVPASGDVQRQAILPRFAGVFRRYRILFVIYGLGLLAGVREFFVARHAEPVDWDSEAWAEMTNVMVRVNPGDPDTDFLQGVRSMVHGNGDEMVSHYETALAANVKHNEFLLQDYAQHLMSTGANWREVNTAVNLWRTNHPFSDETLAVALGTGPRSQSDVAVLVRELRRVAWIADAQLEPRRQGTQQRWSALITFRPARPVDVREAVAALSILAVPERDRARYAVTCRTLTDCSARPR